MVVAIGSVVAFAIIVGIYVLQVRLHHRTIADWERKLLPFIHPERRK